MGSSYTDLPIELSHPRKGLINIKNKDQKCFLWCYVRHINLKDHPGKNQKGDKRLASNLNYDGIEFLVRRSKYRTISLLMCLAMKISWSFQFTFLIKILTIQ